MKLLVTGGAGFIGSEFISQISKRDYDVTIVDSLTHAGYCEIIESSECTFSQTDIRDKDSLSEIFVAGNLDHVVNFAFDLTP
jgi:dTDP-D-glucose 4,6-dehydratase